VHRGVWRKVMGQVLPGDPGPVDVEDGVEYLPLRARSVCIGLIGRVPGLTNQEKWKWNHRTPSQNAMFWKRTLTLVGIQPTAHGAKRGQELNVTSPGPSQGTRTAAGISSLVS
jgi:hypothetical protein